MVHFSKAELAWMTSEIKSAAEQYNGIYKAVDDQGSAVLAKMRAEQMESIAKKLDKVLESESKRIAVD